jgi:hypothetical protein
MNHSMQFNRPQIQGIYRDVKKLLSDHNLLIDAFDAVRETKYATSKNLTIKHIDDCIDYAASRSQDVANLVVFYKLLSFLVKNKSIDRGVVNDIIQIHINSHCRPDFYGVFSIEQDGQWMIDWKLNDTFDERNRVTKFDKEIGFVIPEPFIEVMNSTFLCLNKGSLISAMSLMLVALEPALWDHLSTRGISRGTIIEYPKAVIASLGWNGTDFNFAIKNHDRSNKPLSVTGVTDLVIERRDSPVGPTFKLEVDPKYYDWFSDQTDPKITTASGKLNEAIQRARKAGLLTNAWEPDLDNTFRVLRNELVHESVRYNDVNIETPYGPLPLQDLSRNLDLCLFFISRIIQYISQVYFEVGLTRLADSKFWPDVTVL